MAETRDIMGIPVVSAAMDEAVALIDARLDAGERIKLAYLNAHGSNLAAGDKAYRDALGRFTVLNDGSGLNIASRILHGRPFAANLNGTDFTPYFLRTTRHRFRIFLLGAQPAVAEEAAAVLARLAPQHTLAGVRDGYFPAAEAADVAAGVAATGADLVIVALGNPAQELFLDRNFDAMGCRLAIGVGALLDFLAGRVPRAPAGFRRLGLEWVHRLGLEPGRMWRRYVLGNPRFLARVLAARMKGPVKINKTHPVP